MSVESSSHGRNSPEERAIFDISGLDHAVVHRYQPNYLGRGGENIVYEIPDHPDIVAKASIGSIESGIDSNLAHGRSADAFPEERRVVNEELIQKGKIHLRHLRDFFGNEHVPNYKQMIVKIPLTEAILKHIYQDKTLPKASECWALVTVQKKVSQITQGKHVSPFSQYYPEWDFVNVEKQADEDIDFKKCICDFLEKVQQYTTQTRNFLDIWGPDNIVFFKSGEKWTYAMVDTTNEDEDTRVDSAKVLATKLESSEMLTEDEGSALFWTLRYVLNMFVLCKRLGIENKLSLVDGGYEKHLALFNRLSRTSH